MSKSQAEEKTPKNPLVACIEQFDHAVRDIEACARLFVPLSAKHLIDRHKSTIEDLDKAIVDVESKDSGLRAEAFGRLDSAFSRLDRLEKSQIPLRLQDCLFVGLFSAYDAFIGDLLTIIFAKRPGLFDVVQREIRTSEVFKFASIDALKSKILYDYVEDLRRKSYVEQFAQLENLFGVPLRKFDRWGAFVEAAQRRNLFTHCNGVVSEQYLKVCKEVGVTLPDDTEVGKKLSVSPKYFLASCLVVQEVGIKLAHTLWRKLFDSEAEEADQALSDLVYGHLKNEKLEAAVRFGEFAHGQKKFSSKQWQLIITVNYAIALRHADKKQDCVAIMAASDMTGALPEFRLAKAVLTEKYSEAAEIMKKIGKQGEFVSETSYRVWPLFRDFRATSEFRNSYRKIYGYDFLDEIRKAASEVKSVAPSVATLASEPRPSADGAHLNESSRERKNKKAKRKKTG